jgi:hypothetical protein
MCKSRNLSAKPKENRRFGPPTTNTTFKGIDSVCLHIHDFVLSQRAAMRAPVETRVFASMTLHASTCRASTFSFPLVLCCSHYTLCANQCPGDIVQHLARPPLQPLHYGVDQRVWGSFVVLIAKMYLKAISFAVDLPSTMRLVGAFLVKSILHLIPSQAESAVHMIMLQQCPK